MPLKLLAKHTRFNYLRVSADEELHGIDYYNHYYHPDKNNLKSLASVTDKDEIPRAEVIEMQQMGIIESENFDAKIGEKWEMGVHLMESEHWNIQLSSTIYFT